jgi:glycosyltransferase involved in cell wall biosynthesis
MTPRLTIVIKALNEENHIEKCLTSVINATKNIPALIILADSLSMDKTIEKASQYKIKIVQLENINDRSCGIGPQLGFQYAQGDYIYILDGDMEIVPQFLETAIQKLETNPKLAGVAGSVEEMCIENIEFANRAKKGFAFGTVNRLAMGGLYKRKALDDVGYFSNINLHAFEEIELGLRLITKGWTLERIAVPAVKHYGHTDTSIGLIIKRFKSKYLYGSGELIKSAIGKPYFLMTLWNAKFLIATLALLLTSIILLLSGDILYAIALYILEILTMSIKKRSVKEALFSIFTWHMGAAGLLCGLFSQQRNTQSIIASKIIQEQL